MVHTTQHARLMAGLSEAYTRHAPRSAALNGEAMRYMVDGGSHALRLIRPFPLRIVAARGAWVMDEDGHRLLDFWQGHFANILGHNPPAITSALAEALASGFGLQTGFTDRLQVEVAELLCQRTGAERVRFTTSGTLATMYAIFLARAFTGRQLVLKVGGGWHGAQPWGLKGNSFTEGGFGCVESEGLPGTAGDEVLITRFNDPQMLADQFQTHGDRLACFIVEPFVGAGGSIPATREYLRAARQLTQRHGVVLIFDEVISGFCFRAGDAGALYQVQPDLATFAKIIGGGMPVAAVVGRTDIMNLVGRASKQRVKFSGGTYSAHPASLLAAKTMMTYLVAHEAEVYPRLAELGRKTRETVEAAFAGEGLYARCTGASEDLPGSSRVTVHFPHREGQRISSPDEALDPEICDPTLANEVLQLALLLEDVHVVHGVGALTTAHTEADIAFFGEACRRVARRIKSAR